MLIVAHEFEINIILFGGPGRMTCVRPGIQSEDQNQFFTFKVRTF